MAPSSPQLIIDDAMRGLVAELNAAPKSGGKRAEIARRGSVLFNISIAQFYRRAEKYGFNSGRKPRIDRGQSKLPDDLVIQLASAKHQAMRKNGKSLISDENVIAMFAANGAEMIDPKTGEILPLNVSRSTLAARARALNVHQKQTAIPTPNVQLASSHPNHVWQIDASTCVLYYMNNTGAVKIEAEEIYDSKPDKINKIAKHRVTRYVITDHYSGAFYVEYFAGAENSENLINFFLNAISKRNNEPFHGVPKILMMDMGAANMGGLFMNLLKNLGVSPMPHAPGRARVTGQVEKHQDIVECGFEALLSFRHIPDLSELNERVAKWRVFFNATKKHSRHQNPRYSLWMTIKSDQLRIAPNMGILRELVATVPVAKTVNGDLTISHAPLNFPSAKYDVRNVPGIQPKMHIMVMVNPFRAPNIDVYLGDNEQERYEIAPIPVDAAGFRTDEHRINIGTAYAQLPQNNADIARDQLNVAAHGTSDAKDIAKRKKSRGYEPFGGQINPFAAHENVTIPDYLPRRGHDLITPAAAIEMAPLSLVEAASRLKGVLGDQWGREQYQYLSARYPNGVPPDAIDGIIAQLQAQISNTPQSRNTTSNGAKLRLVG